MRTLLLAGALAVAGFAIATPISVAPASAQVAVDTPIGGVSHATIATTIDPLIAPTVMIADIADAALSRSSATTALSAESAVATRSTRLENSPGAHKSVGFVCESSCVYRKPRSG
jgi:hypothetical protein